MISRLTAAVTLVALVAGGTTLTVVRRAWWAPGEVTHRGVFPGEANRAALAGAVAAMAACALVDFPFQRPAETFTFWTVSALLARDAAAHADSG